MRLGPRTTAWLIAAGVSGAGAALALAFSSGKPGAPWQRPWAGWFSAGLATPGLSLPGRFEGGAGDYAPVTAFPNLRFDDPVALVPLPRSNTLLVLERRGKILAFENDVATGDKRVVLDLSDVTLGAIDSGLLWIVFHPEFGDPVSPNRRFVYVQYAHSPTPHVRAPIEEKTVTSWRLSRFEADPASGVFDRASELVLIQQRDESLYHQGGSMFFHPRDGFLYVSLGDEGLADENVQRIDKDLYSGVIRIDVDQRGGSVSHPIRKQPESGHTAHYFIPSDNPFVGRPGALEEFYALGLRNPHRMTYDPVDDRIWIGDVGRSKREEIDILLPGANYQWNTFEGKSKNRPPVPKKIIGKWTPPILDMERQDASGIIGGYVYRGSRNPELAGKYVFADFVSGNVWALSYEKTASSVRAGEMSLLGQTAFRSQATGITSFGLDAAGELYFVTLGKGAQIWRLEPRSVRSNAPELLSQTGAFKASPRPEPVASAIPYTVRHPFWSDGARKERWMVLPEGKTIEYAPSGPFAFPEGTVFIKHFALALDETRPDELSPLETRLLVAGDGGAYYGVTYRWNAAGTDGQIVLSRQEVNLEVRALDGRTRVQPYVFPSPSDCMGCHTEKAGHVLGVRAEQLNTEVRGSSGTPADRQQLLAWSERGLFSRPLTASDLSATPRLATLDDESVPPLERLRSYWAANCSMCHGVDETLRSRWDARLATPFDAQGILHGALVNGASLAGSAVVVPGDLDRSMIFVRGQSTDPGFGMPPIGRRTPDRAYLDLLRSWILSLEASTGSPSGTADAGAPH